MFSPKQIPNWKLQLLELKVINDMKEHAELYSSSS